jgi:hypothetical protein
MYEFDYEYLVKQGDKLLTKKGSISFTNLPKNYQEFRTRLGLVIAYIREYKGIEQTVLSKKIGINFFEVENGLRDLRCKKLYELGNALKVPMAILIAFTYCGDGEWTEKNMKEKVNEWKKQNKEERKKKKQTLKNNN